MTTGQDIHDNLPFPIGAISAANTLKALKMAAAAAWPPIKVNEYVTAAGTFSSTIFEYSLSALTNLTEWGVAEVFVDPPSATSEPDIKKRDWWQRRDSSSTAFVWTLVFSANVVGAHNGKPFHVLYQRRPTRITLISETLDDALPYDFLLAYVSWWYGVYGVSNQQTDPAIYRDLVVMWEEAWKYSLRHNITPGLTPGHLFAKDRRK